MAGTTRLQAATVFILATLICIKVGEASTGDRLWMKPISEGVDYYHLRTKLTGSGLQHVHCLKVDLNNPKLHVQPALAHGTIGRLETVGGIARRHKALGAINATFFDAASGKRNWPIGVIMIDGRLVNKTILNRTALGLKPGGRAVFGIPRVRDRIIGADGSELFTVWGINRARKKHEVVLYTPEYGATTHTRTPGREVVVRQGRVTALTERDSIIPADGYVISIDASSPAMFRLPKVGDAVDTAHTMGDGWDGVTQALTGGPRLLENGVLRVSSQQEGFRGGILSRNPRSAVGLTADNRLLMVVVDGRRKGYSLGVTFTELARLMKKLGAVEAMGLDSGGSSTLVAVGRTLNRPSDGSPRPVSNALLILRKG